MSGLLCCYEHRGTCIFLNFDFSPGVCLGVRLLDHMADVDNFKKFRLAVFWTASQSKLSQLFQD